MYNVLPSGQALWSADLPPDQLVDQPADRLGALAVTSPAFAPTAGRPAGRPASRLAGQPAGQPTKKLTKVNQKATKS